LNILTKICVVLLVVASLVAFVVFTSLATVHPNYRYEFEQEREAYKRIESTCRNYMEANRRLSAALKEARSLASKSQIELQAEADQYKAKNQALELLNANKDSQLVKINADLAALRESVKANVALSEKRWQDLQQSWARETKLQQEMIQLKDQWKEQQARAERLAQNNRVLKEQAENLHQQNVELTRKIKDLEAGGLASSEGEGDLTPEHKIAGTITAVRDNIASINVGSAHGLKKGMQLIVFRGAQYVGHLKVERVDANEAAGVMTQKVLSPMQGDKVTSSLN